MPLPRSRTPIPIRSIQDLVDLGIGGAAPPPAVQGSWGMNPRVREQLAGYGYGYAPPPVVAPPEPVAPAGNPYPSTLDASLYGPAQAAAPTSEAEYWTQRYQQELLEQQAQRQEQRRQFNVQQGAQQDAAILQRFGQYVPRTAAPTATGLAGQQMAARDQISQERIAAQEQRNQLQAAVGAQQAQGQLTGAAPLVSQPPLYDPRQMGYRDPNTTRAGYYADEVSQMGPYNPRPQWISGPAFGMSADQSAANTMKGNLAFGIHTTRDNTRGDIGGVRGQGGVPQLQQLAASSVGNPQGEADFAQLERQVLGDPNNPDQYPASPRASLLERGEDPGVNATPLERAYYLSRQRRPRANRPYGSTPYDQPAY